MSFFDDVARDSTPTINPMPDALPLQTLVDALMPLLAPVPRMLGMVTGMQVLPAGLFPTLVRNAVAIAFGLMAAPLVVADPGLQSAGQLMWGALLVKEVLVGLVLGLVLGLPLAAFESLGILMDTQSGQNNAATYDPVSEHELGPTGSLLRLLGTTIYLATGLFGVALQVVLWSYKAWPIGATAPLWEVIGGDVALSLVFQFLGRTVLLAFPVLLALLALEMAVGFLNRVVPQLNVFTVSMPLKASVALLVLTIELVAMTDSFVALLRFPLPVLRAWLQMP